MGNDKPKHFVWVAQDDTKAKSNALALYAKACAKGKKEQFYAFRDLRQFFKEYGQPTANDKLTIIAHGTPGAALGSVMIGRYTPSELADFVFTTPGLKNLGKIVLLCCSDSRDLAGGDFDDFARVCHGYTGKTVSYLAEVSVGNEATGWARHANEIDKAVSDDGRADMVPIKSDRARFRVERTS